MPTLLRIAHYFVPGEQNLTTLDPEEALALKDQAAWLKQRVDTISYRLSHGGSTDYFYNPLIGDAQTPLAGFGPFTFGTYSTQLGPVFFSDPPQKRTMVIIHEASHRYLWALDGDGTDSPAIYTEDRVKYTADGTGSYEPIDSFPVYRNIENGRFADVQWDRYGHADTFARFCDYWYLP